MLAALLITTALAAPATLTDRKALERPVFVEKTADKAVVLAQASLAADPNAAGHEPTFLEQYLIYQLSPVPLAQVKDGLVMSHVIGYLLYGCAGGLWGPVVSVNGAEFSGDVALTWFLSGLIWFGIATIATGTGIGALLFLVVPYLTTTATLNAIDRQMKAKGLKPPPSKDKPPEPGTTTPPPDTPPPSYAY